MKISIFGMGYVGAVSGACLAELGHEIIGVDTNLQKVESLNSGVSPIVERGVDDRVRSAVQAGRMTATNDVERAVAGSEVSLISVGTPSDSAGQVSFAAIDGVVREIGQAIRRKTEGHAVVLRSTVPPGTTEGRIAPLLEEAAGREIGRELSLSMNPEFLREGSAVKDFYAPPFTVAGSVTQDGYARVEELYHGIEAPFVPTSCHCAESLKYLSNVYHAVKITFANEFGAVLGSLGMDSREALDLFCQDTDLNISRAYLRPGFAFGGSCLPKEIRAITAQARALGLEVPMLSSVLQSNRAQIDRAFELISSGGRRKVALFGLAFKPGTDDLRESPFVALAERLIGRGFELAIYDHSLEIGRLVGTNRDFIEREIPHLDRLLAPDPETALAGAEVVVVGHVDPAGKAAVLEQAGSATLVDLAGVREFQEMPGLDYRGICW